MEKWKKIEKFRGYYVSNLGNVKSIDRVVRQGERDIKIKGKQLTPQYDVKGYKRVNLRCDSRGHTVRVHILVWDAFGDRKRIGKQIDHIDQDKTNNNINNLRLLSNRQNAANRNKSITTSKYVGVSKTKCGKWLAQIWHNKAINLGRYDTEEQAHSAYLNKMEEINEAR